MLLPLALENVNRIVVQGDKHVMRATEVLSECATTAEEVTTTATVVREHMMWCYDGLSIEEIVAKNSNFCRRMLVHYIAIQKCLACRIDGMGKVESAKVAAVGLPQGR